VQRSRLGSIPNQMYSKQRQLLDTLRVACCCLGFLISLFPPESFPTLLVFFNKKIRTSYLSSSVSWKGTLTPPLPPFLILQNYILISGKITLFSATVVGNRYRQPSVADDRCRAGFFKIIKNTNNRAPY
jgi:hypothetical protein